MRCAHRFDRLVLLILASHLIPRFDRVGIFPTIEAAAIAYKGSGFSVYVTQSAIQAAQLRSLLQTLSPDVSLYHFPDWETLPYDRYSPSPDIIAERLNTLYRIRDLRVGVVVTSMDAIMSRLCPPSFLNAHALSVSVGDRLPMQTLCRRLVQAGFAESHEVRERGQFCRRGALLDVFLPGSHFPFRLDYFDDEIDSIRVFDARTQLSAAAIETVELFPSREIDLSDAGRVCFRQSMRQHFAGKAEAHPVYQRVSSGDVLGGLEYYLPFFFDQTVNFFDYLPKNAQVYIAVGHENYFDERFALINQRYHQYAGMDSTKPLSPAQLYLDKAEWLAVWQGADKKPVQPSVRVLTLPENGAERMDLLLSLCRGDRPFYLFCQSPGQLALLREQVDEKCPERVHDIPYADWHRHRHRHGMGVGDFSSCCEIADEQPFYLLSAMAFLSTSVADTASQETIDSMAVIDDLSAISIGTPVVHHEHGVGRYQGLECIDVDGESSEYITITYAGNSKLFIPVTSLDRVTRYTGGSPDNAPLHSLDGKQWQKAKSRAEKKIHDIAAQLLDIYARRAMAKHSKIIIDHQELATFAANFLFKPTPDQVKTFKDVYSDLALPEPMDRIVCGDVGFGKTEVALRAAFAVANAGKQVVVLAPTTLLVEQHLSNFEARFADFAITVAGLSRFKTSKEQKAILSDIAAGKIDVIIGTHRLLQKDISLANLGLLIVDEEHKFGVKQKEKIKSLRSEVNLLTLTATPIPRTLSMSLSGLRDLSIIASPPPKRVAVETIVSEYDEAVIAEGIMREVARGGQIYFVYNDIATITHIKSRLQQRFPDLAIRHAHGQMPEKQLEHIMLDFHQQRFDLLVTTTIIESGIDNPNANTILINRADKFGLAQLHQLRGRVGRSSHRAYAYLLTPGESMMSRDANKRLAAFSALKGLGIGFMIASQDMEIRGAGELLGANQSGQMLEIGFGLFNTMLTETVDAMKNNREVDFTCNHTDIDIDLGYPALIPDSYIYDVHMRLVFYKRIASCRCERELRRLYMECIDRFGVLPGAVKVLFLLFEIKLLARQLGVSKLSADATSFTLTLEKHHHIDSERLIALIQQQPMQYQLKGQNRLLIVKATDNWQSRGKFIKDWLLDFVKAPVAA